ncbi:hypothetical protein IC582_030341 [Cucumis melo]
MVYIYFHERMLFELCEVISPHLARSINYSTHNASSNDKIT